MQSFDQGKGHEHNLFHNVFEALEILKSIDNKNHNEN